MSAMRTTNNYNDYATRIRAKRAHARKMARRRAITLTLAGLTFVIGINILLAKHDAAVQPAMDRMIAQERRELDRKAEGQTDSVFVNGRGYEVHIGSGK